MAVQDRLDAPGAKGMHRKKRWDELSPRTRKLIIIGAAVEGALKVAALVDLARRPAGEIRGSKAKWAAAIVVVNSAGALPLYYFARGRRPSAHQAARNRGTLGSVAVVAGAE